MKKNGLDLRISKLKFHDHLKLHQTYEIIKMHNPTHLAEIGSRWSVDKGYFHDKALL
jgi:hypothetical protein